MQKPPSRWRVMVVRLGRQKDRKLHKLLPGSRRIRARDLPAVVRITHDQRQAEVTAHRLRNAGCSVILVEEPQGSGDSAFCVSHPTRLATSFCAQCHCAICSDCTALADGEDICPSCLAAGRSPRYRVRLRQLFVVFVFSVFLYQVVDYIQSDRAAVDPSGPVRVAILQFVPPGAMNAPIVRHLNGQSTQTLQGDTLADLAPWFNAERQRYGGTQPSYLRVDLMGPWLQSVQPPSLATPDSSPWDIMQRSWSYASYFRQLGRQHDVDLNDYGVRTFIIYHHRRGDLAAHSRSSAKGRLSIAWISLYERSPSYAMETVAHEIAHALNAEDTYDPDTFLPRHPEGYIEPFAKKHRFAELMAVDIPKNDQGQFSEIEISRLSQVRIGHHTAAKMGWISADEAADFYRPPSATPADLLTNEPTEPSPATARPPGPDPGNLLADEPTEPSPATERPLGSDPANLLADEPTEPSTTSPAPTLPSRVKPDEAPP